MIPKITITWDDERDKNTIASFNDEWNSLNPIAQLDNLKDAIFDLQNIYDALLHKLNNAHESEQ